MKARENATYLRHGGPEGDLVSDITSPHSGGATPRRIVKSVKQPLACVTQLVPLDGSESGRPAHLLSRYPAQSLASEASVSEVRSELCSVALEEPNEESSSSFEHRRLRHGNKANSSISRSRASRAANGSRGGRPRRSFRSVSSREVEESFLSYSDGPAFYRCDSDASTASAATEGSSYSMSYTAISESVPSCSLTVLADPGKSTTGGWASRFRKINGPSRKDSGSFGSIFGGVPMDPYSGAALTAHGGGAGREAAQASLHPPTTSTAASIGTGAASAAAAGHRKSADSAAGISPKTAASESIISPSSPSALKNTIRPLTEVSLLESKTHSVVIPASPSPPVLSAPATAAAAAPATSAQPEKVADVKVAAAATVAGDSPAVSPSAMDSAEQRHKVQNVKLLERVGRGTFGDVYRGEDLDTGNVIAVKEIVVPHDFTKDVEKQLAALESEIRVMRRLHHPHVVTYLGANREGNSLRIFMEFIGGGTVGSMLLRDGALAEEKTRDYTAQLLEGLEYLHASHILHRDLKGDNLFLTEQDQLKLGDFGQSKELADTLITQSVQGTPSFMSPEMIACAGYSFEADVWSVGCCVIQMLTGKPPFSNLDNQMAVMFAIISSKIEEQIPDDISDGAKDFIRMCTKTNIKDRWTATQLRQHPWLLGPVKKTMPANAAEPPKGANISKKLKTTEKATAQASKPPRSILLDTAALSKTSATEEVKRTTKGNGTAGFPDPYGGDTPDNEAGGTTSSNLSSCKAESPNTKNGATVGAATKPSRLAGPSRSPRKDNSDTARSRQRSPTTPTPRSPSSARKDRRGRTAAATGTATGAAHDNGPLSPTSAAITRDAGTHDPQGRPMPKPHPPAQSPSGSSPRHRPGMGDTSGKKRTAGAAAAASSATNPNGAQPVNTLANAQALPRGQRRGSRPLGSAIQRGTSPGNQTSRTANVVAVTKPQAPATSRASSQIHKEARKK